MNSDSIQEIAKLLSGVGSGKMADIGISAFAFVLFFSLCCAFFCSFLYVKFYSSRSTGSQIQRAFPLLGLSITAIFVCVQFSLPLSLGLLGALSIVRFRTPIKEPEEIAFIMLVVATSIGSATFSFLFVGLVLGLAVVALLVSAYGPRLLTNSLQDGLVLIKLPESDYLARNKDLFGLLQQKLVKGALEGVAKNGNEYTISYNFSALKKTSIPEFQGAFNELFKNGTVDIYLNRPHAI